MAGTLPHQFTVRHPTDAGKVDTEQKRTTLVSTGSRRFDDFRDSEEWKPGLFVVNQCFRPENDPGERTQPP